MEEKDKKRIAELLKQAAMIDISGGIIGINTLILFEILKAVEKLDMKIEDHIRATESYRNK